MPTYGCFNPCGRYDSIKKDDDIYDYICFCCAFVASFYCWPKSYSICFSCSRSCTLHRVPSSLPRNWASNKKSLLSCSFFGILYNTINNKSLQTFFSFWKTYLCCAILSLVSSYYTFAHIPVCHHLLVYWWPHNDHMRIVKYTLIRLYFWALFAGFSEFRQPYLCNAVMNDPFISLDSLCSYRVNIFTSGRQKNGNCHDKCKDSLVLHLQSGHWTVLQCLSGLKRVYSTEPFFWRNWSIYTIFAVVQKVTNKSAVVYGISKWHTYTRDQIVHE